MTGSKKQALMCSTILEIGRTHIHMHLLLLSLLVGSASASADPSFPGVWPLPRSFTNGTGVSLVDGSAFSLLDASSDDRLAVAFARFQKNTFLHAAAATPAAGQLGAVNVTVAHRDVDLQLGTDESYSLTIPETISSGGRALATLSASTVYGAMRGLETLSQLIRFDFDASQYTIAAAPLQIDDSPRFPHREILLDSARHYQPVRVIEEVIDSLAMGKINTVHWHLSDSQSFPVVLPSHPELSKTAAFSLGERYTPGDIRAVVEYARSYGIRVVVEVDTPGHAASWCLSHPEVCPAPSCPEPLLVSNNATFSLIEDIFTDLRRATTDKVFHLGGDEVQYGCWNSSAPMTAWMAAEGMKPGDFDAAYEYSILRVAEIAKKLGRAPTVWGEVWDHLGTALPKDTIVDFWLGGGVSSRGVLNATSHGYRTLWNVDRGANIGSWYLDSTITTWDTMYAREPCSNLNDEQCKLVLGGGGELWGEKVDPSDIEQTLWPRLAAIAERLWSPRAATSGKGAVAAALPRLEDFRCLLEERGVAAAPVTNANARSAPTGPGSCRRQ